MTELQPAWNIKVARGGKDNWGSARGPVAVLLLGLRRIGWSMTKFNVFTDREGIPVKLTDFSPKAVQQMLAAAHSRVLAAKVAKDFGISDELSLQPPKRCTRARKFTAQQQGLIRAFGTGAPWTNSRRKAAGYDVEDRCPMCGDGSDTMGHKLYKCRGNDEIIRTREGLHREGHKNRRAPSVCTWFDRGPKVAGPN